MLLPIPLLLLLLLLPLLPLLQLLLLLLLLLRLLFLLLLMCCCGCRRCLGYLKAAAHSSPAACTPSEDLATAAPIAPLQGTAVASGLSPAA
jgi:hypothetical protein